MHADGTCPSCGQAVDPGRAHGPDANVTGAPGAPGVPGATPVSHAATAVDGGDDDDLRPPIPWHLWLLLAALTVYLGYRALQGLEWVFGF